MHFHRSANTLTSSDGRYLIERWDDHRGRTYSASDTRPAIDWGWLHIGNYGSAQEAQDACVIAFKYGGTI